MPGSYLSSVAVCLILALGLPFQVSAKTDASAPLADSCRSVDYRSDLGKAYDQGPTNWCYAFTAADMITQALHLSPVSPLATAHSAYAEKSRHKKAEFETAKESGAGIYDLQDLYRAYRDSLADDERGFASRRDGGDVRVAIEAASRRGICFEKDVPSDNGLDSKFAKSVQHSTKLSLVDPKITRTPIAGDDGTCTIYDARTDPVTELTGSTKRIRYAAEKAAWESAIAKRCQSYAPPVPFKYASEKFGEGVGGDGKIGKRPDERERTLRFVNEGLEHGRIVGIGYNSAPFRGRSGDPEMHASSIVGRVCDGACNCRYRLRNSWGRHPCTDKGGYKGDFAKRCDADGTILITADEIQDYVYDAIYLK